MRKLFTFIIFFLLFFNCSGQQYNTWYFGNSAGISFNTGGSTLPYVLIDDINSFNEGNASISDANGNILFYTNGKTVFNRTHHVMLNGDNLMGNQSAVQSSLIIPLPGNDSIYYLFTTDAVENNFANGYRYSIINMLHDGGNGEVITKNILLNGSSTERLTAARHANGIDVWVIGNEQNSNVFKAWLVTCTGLQPSPIVSVTGMVLNNEDIGMMKVSPDGKQLCQTNYPTDAPENFFQLFDFDNATGTLSNPRTINIPITAYYSCEFSPDSRFLYVTRVTARFIDQFESKLGSAAAIVASRVSVPSAYGFYGIQTGPDGKIYLNNSTTKLSVINNPNVKGIPCNYEADKIDLGNRNGVLGLPSAINDGPIDPFNNFTFTIIDSCAGTVQFNGQTNLGGTIIWSWDFGNGITSALQNPSHTFTSHNQLYNVKLTVRSSAGCGYIEKTQSLSPGGIAVKAGFSFIQKCDSGYIRFSNSSTIYPADNSVQYSWDFGDGHTSTETNPIHNYTGSNIFTVKLKVKTGTACFDDSISKNVDFQQLNIQVPPALTIDAGQSVQLFVTGGGTNFQWTPEQWLNDPAIANPIAKPQNNITYTVTVTNEAGCKDVDSVTIHLNPVDGIYMPTGFTPGSDGLNDIAMPIMSGQFTLKEFTIFNRWGEKIFSTTEHNKGWDGWYNGKLQTMGAYIWVIKATDGQQKLIEKKGTLTLVR